MSWQQDAINAAMESGVMAGQGDVRELNLLRAVHREDDRERWTIDKVQLTREQVMSAIVEMVYNGAKLKQICEYPGSPRIGTVMRWKERFATFASELERAQKAQASILAEESVIDAETLPPKEAKVRGESKRWLAAKYDDKFADKQKIETSSLDGLSRAEVEEQFAMLMMNASKGLKTKLQDALAAAQPKTIEVEPIPAEEPSDE